MAKWLALNNYRDGSFEISEGAILDDAIYPVAWMKTSGLAAIAYDPTTMGPSITAWLSGKFGSLLNKLIADGVAADPGEVPTTRTISTTAPLTGGGDLSANRTLAISAATPAAAGAMSAADKTKLNGIPSDAQSAAQVATSVAAGVAIAEAYADTGDAATLLAAERQTTTNPGAALDADTDAETLRLLGYPAVYAQTAARAIDMTTCTKSCRIRIVVGAINGSPGFTSAPLTATVSADPTWISPMGLGQDCPLPFSGDQMCSSFDLLVDVPNKTFRIVVLGMPTPMLSAPTASPGDTLDPTAGTGVYTGNGGQGFYQTGAPTSDGSAFGANRVNNTKTLENRGDGHGALLLMEPSRINFCFQNQTLFTGGGAIVAPWVAINGNCTGIGTQAGSPLGDATVCNLVFAGADATTGVKQALTSTANTVQTVLSGSVWAKGAAGGEKFRIQWLLKDGTTLTSADFTLTTTWARFDFFCPNIGRFGQVGTAEFRIINGSDAGNRTIKVWRPQVENGNSPSSAILTVAAQVTRTADQLYYTPDLVPASFRTRGIQAVYYPDFSNAEQWNPGTNHTVFAFDGDPILGPNVGRDWALLGLSNEAQVAGGAIRMFSFLSQHVRIANGDAPAFPWHYGPPLTWARGAQLTMTWEAYRGALRAQGFASGSGRYPLGFGPWVYPGSSIAPLSGQLYIGATPGAAVAMNGRYGLLTAA